MQAALPSSTFVIQADSPNAPFSCVICIRCRHTVGWSTAPKMTALLARTHSCSPLYVTEEDRQRDYAHRDNRNGTTDSICMYCYATIATARNPKDLEAAEARHSCSRKREAERSTR